MLDIALKLRIGNSRGGCGLEHIPQQELSEGVAATPVGRVPGSKRLEGKNAAGELIA